MAMNRELVYVEHTCIDIAHHTYGAKQQPTVAGQTSELQELVHCKSTTTRLISLFIIFHLSLFKFSKAELHYDTLDLDL